MTMDDIKKIDVDKCQKFSAFAKDQLPMPGTKKRLSQILDQEICIVDYRVRDSKHRQGSKCLQIQFLQNNEVFVTFTGSAVLLDQIQVARENMPFVTRISKIDKYFSFA